MTAKPELDLMKVTEKERKLIEYWRELKYGIIEKVHIEGGQPIRIMKAQRNIKL